MSSRVSNEPIGPRNENQTDGSSHKRKAKNGKIRKSRREEKERQSAIEREKKVSQSVSQSSKEKRSNGE
jgi:hypothetical protein